MKKLVDKCQRFRESLETQIAEFEKQTGGKVAFIVMTHDLTGNVTLYEFNVDFDQIRIRAGGKPPF